MSQNSPQFKITARRVEIPDSERARRLALAYDPLMAVYDRLIALAEGEQQTAENGRQSKRGDVSHEE